MYRTNGGYLLPYRFSFFSLQNAVCSAIAIGVVVVVFFSQYWLSISYINRNISTYSDYLLSNLYKLLETIYFL